MNICNSVSAELQLKNEYLEQLIEEKMTLTRIRRNEQAFDQSNRKLSAEENLLLKWKPPVNFNQSFSGRCAESTHEKSYEESSESPSLKPTC